jgi:hypothetical protein
MQLHLSSRARVVAVVAPPRRELRSCRRALPGVCVATYGWGPPLHPQPNDPTFNEAVGDFRAILACMEPHNDVTESCV